MNRSISATRSLGVWQLARGLAGQLVGLDIAPSSFRT